MAERGWLEPARGGRFVLTEQAEKRYDLGTLHSNLADSGGVDVVDRLTGEVVGRMAQRTEGRGVNIGGAGRKVVKDTGDRILTDTSGAGKGVRYASQGSPLTSLALGRALAEALGAKPDGMLVVRGDGPMWLIHGLGTLGGCSSRPTWPTWASS